MRKEAPHWHSMSDFYTQQRRGNKGGVCGRATYIVFHHIFQHLGCYEFILHMYILDVLFPITSLISCILYILIRSLESEKYSFKYYENFSFSDENCSIILNEIVWNSHILMTISPSLTIWSECKKCSSLQNILGLESQWIHIISYLDILWFPLAFSDFGEIK